MITRNSIEQQIAAGLLVKQNLFEGVLDSSSNTDYVDFSSKGRSQFIDQLEAFLKTAEEEPAADTDADSYSTHEETCDEITKREEDFDEDLTLTNLMDDDAPPEQPTDKPQINESKTAEMEQVMTSGMQFLAGLFKMSTGKDLGLENQQIKINKETGEVTMTFKLPV